MTILPAELETTRQQAAKFWVLWSRSDQDSSDIQRGVDQLLNGYSFYPEFDWGIYGYRAPDGYQVLGAWRHPATVAFVFLLDEGAALVSKSRPRKLLVHAAGSAQEVERCGAQIKKLKRSLSKSAKQDVIDANLLKRLTNAEKLKSTKILLGMLTLFTAVINAFSLYLRKLPTPFTGVEKAALPYSILVIAIHFSALLLLLSLIFIMLAYSLKYGFMLLRRL